MVENNQIYEPAPNDIDADEAAVRGRGFGSKAALAVASGVAMAGGMLMGNQMIVPALIGAVDGQSATQVQNTGNADAASAAELSPADQLKLGNDNSVFAVQAGAAFKKTAFGASSAELAAISAAATKSTDGSTSTTSTVTTAGVQTTTELAGKTADPVVVAPAPTWDTTATNTSSATTVAGGTGTGAGSGSSSGGSYEDHDGDHENHHEDHEDNDDD
ncbi:MAG: hypothetical protein ACKORF_03805 [Micrococcales bacterium]